jgi:hypothetical protein
MCNVYHSLPPTITSRLIAGSFFSWFFSAWLQKKYQCRSGTVHRGTLLLLVATECIIRRIDCTYCVFLMVIGADVA